MSSGELVTIAVTDAGRFKVGDVVGFYDAEAMTGGLHQVVAVKIGHLTIIPLPWYRRLWYRIRGAWRWWPP